jgi:alpha-glucosidase/alpha-D-xyloside xylohydrolase
MALSNQISFSRRKFLEGVGCTAANGLAQGALPRLSKSVKFSIAGADVEFWITPISEHILRVSILAANSHLEPTTAFAGKGLIDRVWPPVKAKFSGTSRSEPMIWGNYRVVVSPEPLTVSVRDDKGTLKQRLIFDSTAGKVNFDLQNNPVFGLGEGGHQFDRRGVVDLMRNGQFKPDQLVNGGRAPIPWLISPSGWALFFHHPMGTFDLTGEQGVFRPAEPAQPQDIFLILAQEPSTVLKEFAQLTGLPHLPPIWALGYQQSHRTLESRDAVLQEVETFHKKNLPCDVMIYLGTGFAPSGWNTGHGSFAFNERVFPDPVAMFREMHTQNVRVVLHVLGVPHDLHGRVADHSTDPDNAANYWRQHLKVFHTGIDGWWVDDGDELPPESRLARNRMYWEGALQQRPDVRPYSLQRNGYAGLQRYGWLWSGDVDSRWHTLRTQIAVGLNTALSGIPYWGTDTGGFFSTKELTAELYIRWFQFSSFCPLFRSHGRTWKLRLPWGWNEGKADPIEDNPAVLPSPVDLHHPEVEEICRKYLNLRYQLLPYLYSTIYTTSQTGMPVMRALWLAFPGEEHVLTIDDAFMWGESMMVAPVVTADAKEREVFLPRGIWYDFWTQQKVERAGLVVRPVDLTTLPLFIRGGSIIPMGPIRHSTAERSSAPLNVYIYPGSDAQFALYEDDGVSMEHQRGLHSVLNMEWRDGPREFSVALARGSSIHSFTSKKMIVHLIGEPETETQVWDGTRKTLNFKRT